MHRPYRTKLGAFILTVILSSTLLVLSACGGGGQLSSAPTSEQTTSVATPTTPAATPATDPILTPTLTASGVPRSSHVVLVIEENHMFSEVYPHGMPWLVAQGDRYGYAINYHAEVPGSLLNYLWLSSGSGEQQFGCNGDNCGGTPPHNGKAITDDNIFRELDNAKKTWKVYAQSLPAGDPTKIYESGAYVSRHNPAVYYSDVIFNLDNDKSKVVPFTQFATDLANGALPSYSIIVPDVNNDAHNGSLAQADAFLANNVAPLLKTPAFQAGGDGLLFITFDECDGAVGACPEVVYTAVIGPNVKRGVISKTFYKHENTLRTILDALGINVYPGASASAADMIDFFK